ncbi:MAG: hypothetical protein OXE99_04575 [Cellvibrionales bacterium]|nr:hypothetical protein [Cellvibrionales bacterium]
MPNPLQLLTESRFLQPNRLRLLKILGLLLCLFGCSTSSIFIPFNVQSTNIKQTIEQDNSPDYAKIKKLATSLARQSNTQDGLLFSQESGRLFQLTNHFSTSKTLFAKTIERYRKQDQSAHLRLTAVGNQSLSLLSNDNVIPYDGEPYEQVMAHQFQALNYLFLNDPTAAAIELRRAAGMQRRIERDEENRKQQGVTAAQKHGISLKPLNQSPKVQQMNQLITENPQGFQNASTYFLSAVFWESQQQWNSALVDYKKALSILPNHPDIQKGIQRVTKARDGKSSPQPETGSLVVLFEQGFVAERAEFSLSIPSSSLEMIHSIAIPVYDKAHWPKTQALTISTKAGSHATTPLVNLSALAAKSLQQDYPALITRQVLRAISKKQLQSEAYKNSQALGLFTSLYSALSEQADLRTWSTLPHSIGAHLLTLPVGNQEIFLNVHPLSQSEHILIQSGRTTLLRVIECGGKLFTQVTVI